MEAFADRLDHLLAKRRSHGLSLDEADELGRLIAERDGQAYENARGLGDPGERKARHRGWSEDWLSSGHLMHDPLFILPPRNETIESELDAPGNFGAPESSVRASRRGRKPRRLQS
jgi:hypothetical protein